MKEIKFRGKRIDNNEWVYGLFARHKIGSLICPCIQVEKESDFGDYIEYIEIDGETLGQYTGLIDMNGKEIYEDDYVLAHEKYQWSFKVKYSDSELGYEMFIDNIMEGNLNEFADNEDILEVIGNIYENPELLKEV